VAAVDGAKLGEQPDLGPKRRETHGRAGMEGVLDTLGER
jgi:hypothetical protein